MELWEERWGDTSETLKKCDIQYRGEVTESHGRTQINKSLI